MDEEIGERIDFLIANLMVYYKGAISYKDFQEMSYADILKHERYASQINQAREREIKKSMSR